MKIAITGGTGFIGSALIQHLSSSPHDLIVFTRGESTVQLKGALTVKYVHWNPYESGEWQKKIDGCDGVINLVGQRVIDRRWNNSVKRTIVDSRIIPTRLLVDAIRTAEQKPRVLVSASAIGYYGDRNDEIITEESSGGDDFLADVVKQWESAAYDAEQYGIRVATPRIGLVLDRNGGLIEKMLLPFRLFAGGPIGSGSQFLPWIHLEDLLRGLFVPLEREDFRGVYNLVGPNPVTMKEFCKTFGSVLRRPSWIPVPDAALMILYGEGAKVVLSGQRALPKKLEDAGFQFSFPDLRKALENILKR